MICIAWNYLCYFSILRHWRAAKCRSNMENPEHWMWSCMVWQVKGSIILKNPGFVRKTGLYQVSFSGKPWISADKLSTTPCLSEKHLVFRVENEKKHCFLATFWTLSEDPVFSEKHRFHKGYLPEIPSFSVLLVIYQMTDDTNNRVILGEKLVFCWKTMFSWEKPGFFSLKTGFATEMKTQQRDKVILVFI